MSGWAAVAKAGMDMANMGLNFASQRYFARRQEHFTKWMASHAHQLEVDDLRKAGLNPILSATGGSGASGSVGLASAPAGGIDLSGAFNTAQHLENSKHQNQLIDQQRALVDEQKATEKTKQRANLEQGALYSALASAKELENFIPSYYIDGLRRNPKDLQRALDQYKSKVVKDSIGGSLGSMNALGALILNSAKSFSQ